MTDPGGLYDDIREEVGRVLIGNEDIIEGLTIALLSDGHVLLEGVPGIAKTTTAELFARASGLDHARIQMTPDVLPADITGTKVYREETGAFETRKGPIFSNVVLADEINRATPKTQSAMLEAMAEQNVTIEGDGYALPSPFLVVATQNPIEMEGTFTLPEAQRDRFQQKLTMDLLARDDERLLLNRFDSDPSLGPDSVEQVATATDLLEARDGVAAVHVAPRVKEYVLDLVAQTRAHDEVEHGASPRASLAFLQAGKARAAIHGREYVIPDDVKSLARPILVHRLVLNTDAEIGGVDAATVVDDVVDSVEPPGGETATESIPNEAADVDAVGTDEGELFADDTTALTDGTETTDAAAESTADATGDSVTANESAPDETLDNSAAEDATVRDTTTSEETVTGEAAEDGGKALSEDAAPSNGEGAEDSEGNNATDGGDGETIVEAEEMDAPPADATDDDGRSWLPPW